MDSTDRCAEIRPMLGELAIGSAAGHERDRAVRHVATCPACGRELAELTTVFDGLLQLAPPADPPPGFESAVVARIARPAARAAGEPRPPHRRRRRALALAAAVVVAALAGGAAGTVATRAQGADDRVLADRYRQVLSVADGQYLRALRLTTDAGAPAGTVFLYQGRPSWVLVSVTSAPVDGTYAMTVVGRDGTDRPVGACLVTRGAGTYGYQLPRPVADIAEVALSTPEGVRLTARVA
jgi:hypothetical protein